MDMPRRAKELTALDVKRLAHPGGRGNAIVAVGGVAGLLLQLTPGGGRSWLLRTLMAGRRREIGLGGYPDVTLAQARDRAREAKDEIRRGIDPIERRRAARAALVTARARGMTFAQAVDKSLDAKLSEFRNAKHAAQWRATLASYAMPALGDMLVSDIAVADVLRALEPLWLEKTETATRLRGRIESVLAWATVAGHRTGDNPARWKGNLDALLPKPGKVAKSDNQPAVQLGDVARWFAAVRQRDGVSARALEFVALTACRSGEARGATWGELDLEAGVWTIPASRMKAGREHRAALSAEAVALLRALPRFEGCDYVFAAPRGGALSDMSLSAVMRRIHAADVAAGGAGYVDRVSGRPAVPHGLRSTFRDWCAEKTDFPRDMAEIALAHNVGDAVERAYRRGDVLEKRRAMAAAWSRFLRGETGARVVALGAAR
jgi:integrase